MTASLTSLPGEALTETFALLDAKDIHEVCLADPTLQEYAEPVVKQALARDGLPGETVADLMDHFSKLETYQKRILEALCEIVPDASSGDNLTSEATKHAIREFLKTAIQKFTVRVSGAHSWYKHLKIGTFEDQKFDFCFDLHVNMRYARASRKWVKKVRGDGSEFHYTWLPTDEYRSRFGFFDYRMPRNAVDQLILLDDDGNSFHVPFSARGPSVLVTAAIHEYTLEYNMYAGLFKAAVEERNPARVRGEFCGRRMLPALQQRFHAHQMHLPKEAADELEKAVEEALMRIGQGVSFDGSVDSEAKSAPSRVLAAQQARERLAIAMSLQELCVRNLGQEYSPTKDDIRSQKYEGRR